MENETEPTFGGSPTIPPPEVFERAQQNNPEWYKIIYKGYEQFAQRPENAGIYAVPGTGSGATIQQMWLLNLALSGIETYCLLARPLSAAATERVTRRVDCSATQLVQWLAALQKADNSVVASLAYHDGRMGHCITLESYDPERDRFIYYDPWPERSLLVKENNAAGVEALAEAGPRRLWSVTAQELERVVFATFLMPWQWARIQNQRFELFESEWRESEFFTFFHLKQVEEVSQDDRVVRLFTAGPFKKEIAITVDASKDSGKIRRASLLIRRDWIIENFALALDITKSFVVSFAPPPDQARYAEIAGALWKLNDPQFMLEAQKADPDESDALTFVHAFMGSLESANITTDFASLSIDGVEEDGSILRHVEFTLA
jgi:hypothetical protein